MLVIAGFLRSSKWNIFFFNSALVWGVFPTRVVSGTPKRGGEGAADWDAPNAVPVMMNHTPLPAPSGVTRGIPTSRQRRDPRFHAEPEMGTASGRGAGKGYNIKCQHMGNRSLIIKGMTSNGRFWKDLGEPSVKYPRLRCFTHSPPVCVWYKACISLSLWLSVSLTHSHSVSLLVDSLSYPSNCLSWVLDVLMSWGGMGGQSVPDTIRLDLFCTGVWHPSDKKTGIYRLMVKGRIYCASKQTNTHPHSELPAEKCQL